MPQLLPILMMLAIPGTFSGRVTNAAGQPLTDAEVIIRGATTDGRQADFQVRTDHDGRYSVRVPAGTYTARAYYNLFWNGKGYRLKLHPSDNDNAMPYDSKPGVVKDFIWRLSGLQAFRNPDPNQPESYYGGAIQIAFSDPMRTGLNAFSDFSSVSEIEISMNPVGCLLDGSEARPLVFRAKKWRNSPRERVLKDIPAGRYVLTARAWTRAGVVPLRVAAALREGGKPTPTTRSVEIAFEPSKFLGPSSDGFETITLYLTKPDRERESNSKEGSK